MTTTIVSNLYIYKLQGEYAGTGIYPKWRIQDYDSSDLPENVRDNKYTLVAVKEISFDVDESDHTNPVSNVYMEDSVDSKIAKAIHLLNLCRES